MDGRVGVPAQRKLYAFSHDVQDPKMALLWKSIRGTATEPVGSYAPDGDDSMVSKMILMRAGVICCVAMPLIQSS